MPKSHVSSCGKLKFFHSPQYYARSPPLFPQLLSTYPQANCGETRGCAGSTRSTRGSAPNPAKGTFRKVPLESSKLFERVEDRDFLYEWAVAEKRAFVRGRVGASPKNERITHGIDLFPHVTVNKPPLCKGRWHGVSRDGGIVRCKSFCYCYNPSVSSADSSLYTREPCRLNFGCANINVSAIAHSQSKFIPSPY